jgi:hypothetical protein
MTGGTLGVGGVTAGTASTGNQGVNPMFSNNNGNQPVRD